MIGEVVFKLFPYYSVNLTVKKTVFKFGVYIFLIKNSLQLIMQKLSSTLAKNSIKSLIPLAEFKAMRET